MRGRLIERGLATDPEFMHLGGAWSGGEEFEEFARRRIFRQWLWERILVDVADDWGRFKDNARLILALLLPGVMPTDLLMSDVRAALDEFTEVGWLGRYTKLDRPLCVVWSWPLRHNLKFSAASKMPGVPGDMAEAEADRRALPAQAECCGGASRERFIALHGWNGTYKTFRETYPDLAVL